MKVVSYYNLLYYTIVNTSRSYIKNLPAAGKVRNYLSSKEGKLKIDIFFYSIKPNTMSLREEREQRGLIYQFSDEKLFDLYTK